MKSRSVVRESKFRHVYGEVWKQKYEDILLATKSTESAGIRGNSKFVAVPWQGAGGSLAVIPVGMLGKVPRDLPKITGHSAPIADFEFSPFNENVLLTGSEDSTLKLWTIPDSGPAESMREPDACLQGHQKKVLISTFNPCAAGVAASASFDQSCKVWDLEKAREAFSINLPDQAFSLKWNYTGSLLAATCKDKRLYLIDPRSSSVVSSCLIQEGIKPAKVEWLPGRSSSDGTHRIATAGFSKSTDRQLCIWDLRSFSGSQAAADDVEALHRELVVPGPQALYPTFDQGSQMLYLAGKGEGTIAYFELTSESPYVHQLSQYASSSTQRAFDFLPKRCVDVGKCELMRALKVEASSIEVISFRVPRKDQAFQEDLYPDCASLVPATTAQVWTTSTEVFEPMLQSMRPQGAAGTCAAAAGGATPRQRTVTALPGTPRTFSGASTPRGTKVAAPPRPSTGAPDSCDSAVLFGLRRELEKLQAAAAQEATVRESAICAEVDRVKASLAKEAAEREAAFQAEKEELRASLAKEAADREAAFQAEKGQFCASLAKEAADREAAFQAEKGQLSASLAKEAADREAAFQAAFQAQVQQLQASLAKEVSDRESAASAQVEKLREEEATSQEAALRAQLDEAKRIEAGLRTQLEQAEGREATVRADLAKLKAQLAEEASASRADLAQIKAQLAKEAKLRAQQQDLEQERGEQGQREQRERQLQKEAENKENTPVSPNFVKVPLWAQTSAVEDALCGEFANFQEASSGPPARRPMSARRKAEIDDPESALRVELVQLHEDHAGGHPARLPMSFKERRELERGESGSNLLGEQASPTSLAAASEAASSGASTPGCQAVEAELGSLQHNISHCSLPSPKGQPEAQASAMTSYAIDLGSLDRIVNSLETSATHLVPADAGIGGSKADASAAKGAAARATIDLTNMDSLVSRIEHVADSMLCPGA